ncbi:MAG: hypothetical protein ABL907_24085 [Hyphomicrobium sp.]
MTFAACLVLAVPAASAQDMPLSALCISLAVSSWHHDNCPRVERVEKQFAITGRLLVGRDNDGSYECRGAFETARDNVAADVLAIGKAAVCNKIAMMGKANPSTNAAAANGTPSMNTTCGKAIEKVAATSMASLVFDREAEYHVHFKLDDASVSFGCDVADHSKPDDVVAFWGAGHPNEKHLALLARAGSQITGEPAASVAANIGRCLRLLKKAKRDEADSRQTIRGMASVNCSTGGEESLSIMVYVHKASDVEILE